MLFKGFDKEEQEHIKLIQSQIDFEHSIIIRHPVTSGMYSVYIIEFKTEEPNCKTFFAVNEADAKHGVFYNNICTTATAIFDPDILDKIPVWECEVSKYELTQLDMYRSGVEYALDHIYRAQQCQRLACPESGEFTAYKKVIGSDDCLYICELRMPENARRLSGFERKCRTDKAEVIAMWELECVDPYGCMHFRKTRKRVAHSFYDKDFVYRVGETVTPTNGFDTNRFNTCAPGIHFFMTMVEAFTYRF